MSNQMWGGRFASGPDAIMEEINASIDFDRKLALQDIAGSKAHVAMLAATGIVSAADAQTIDKGSMRSAPRSRAALSSSPARSKIFT